MRAGSRGSANAGMGHHHRSAHTTEHDEREGFGAVNDRTKPGDAKHGEMERPESRRSILGAFLGGLGSAALAGCEGNATDAGDQELGNVVQADTATATAATDSGTGTDESASAALPVTSGLALWLRADKGVTSGSTFIWNDQSGQDDPGRNATQSSAANRPTLNTKDPAYHKRPTIGFKSSTRQSLSTGSWSTPLQQPCTWFIVGNDDGSSTNQTYLWNADGATYMIATNNGGQGICTYAGGADFPHVAPNTPAPRIIAAVFDGAIGSRLYVNACTVSDASALGTNGQSGGVDIGFQRNGAWLNGRIAEIIAFDRALSDDEVEKVLSYASRRYQIPLAPCTAADGSAIDGALKTRVEVAPVAWDALVDGFDQGRDGLMVNVLPGFGTILFGGWNPAIPMWEREVTNELWHSPSGRFDSDATLLQQHNETPPSTGSDAQPRPRHGAQLGEHVCLDGKTRLFLAGGDIQDMLFWRTLDPLTNGFQADFWLYGHPLAGSGEKRWTQVNQLCSWKGSWGAQFFSLPPCPDKTGRPNGTLYRFGGATAINAASEAAGLQTMWKSDDDGVTWTPMPDTPFPARMFACS